MSDHPGRSSLVRLEIAVLLNVHVQQVGSIEGHAALQPALTGVVRPVIGPARIAFQHTRVTG